ncbi:hypothetical protein Pcar_3476 [Syntrophotalea carbinolica DSM 2380]|uniref:Uncharacterized protein n=1 Tax=Syntrophotalea carbinolica (strain DSM 2380 / NBRC 103641 / GraBd1) TaxID=338963 RepID=J9TJQ9_SYNC1|nr:hypothetical protein Pcar_3476 [Syntrophotalea carbinolica DSM 2380]
MIIICSWCKRRLGWVNASKGESHGICLKCLQEFFPEEGKTIVGRGDYRALVTHSAKPVAPCVSITVASN